MLLVHGNYVGVYEGGGLGHGSRFRQIMKQACWSDDDIVAGLEELEVVVPSAESILKEIGWVLVCWYGVMNALRQ